MIRGFRNAWRLLAIARILARHDALFGLEQLGVARTVVLAARLLGRGDPAVTDGRPGERLARALQEAGPSFIKVGQALSTRSDLLGEEMAADLSTLQDSLEPFSGDQARDAIEAEFQAPVESLFRVFDDTAIAAASIAQVHFAETIDGREVAVKILRPDIEEAFEADLDLFFWVAQLVERARPQWRRLKPVASVETLAETVALEMDLRFEAAAAAELAENFADDDTFDVPEVDWPLTGRRVLTMARISGIPLDDRAAVIAAGHDPEEVLTRAAVAFFHQIFRDGFFHGDLHPGNLFVEESGAIGAVDFGIMGRLDRHTRRHLGEMLLAFLSRDYRRAAQVHFEAGWVPFDKSVEAFTQACRSIGEPILDRPQNEISIAKLLAQLFQVTETFQMEAQPQLLLLQKTMLVAEGTGRSLAPDANMWLLARPLIEDWIAETFSPDAVLREGAADVASTLSRLPNILDGMEKSAAALQDGRVRLHPDTISALNRRDDKRNALWVWCVVLFCTLAIFVIW
jgi:ubiquinone biosynthesis protein